MVNDFCGALVLLQECFLTRERQRATYTPEVRFDTELE